MSLDTIMGVFTIAVVFAVGYCFRRTFPAHLRWILWSGPVFSLLAGSLPFHAINTVINASKTKTTSTTTSPITSPSPSGPTQGFGVSITANAINIWVSSPLAYPTEDPKCNYQAIYDQRGQHFTINGDESFGDYVSATFKGSLTTVFCGTNLKLELDSVSYYIVSHVREAIKEKVEESTFQASSISIIIESISAIIFSIDDVIFTVESIITNNVTVNIDIITVGNGKNGWLVGGTLKY